MALLVRSLSLPMVLIPTQSITAMPPCKLWRLTEHQRCLHLHDARCRWVDQHDSDTVTIQGANDAPVHASIEGTALSYNENAGAVAISSTIAITDVDDVNIESAIVAITGNYVTGQDVLGFTNQNGITGSGTRPRRINPDRIGYRSSIPSRLAVDHLHELQRKSFDANTHRKFSPSMTAQRTRTLKRVISTSPPLTMHQSSTILAPLYCSQ